MSAHRNYYAYFYRRNLWLKPLLSDTVWAIQNRVRKLHYIERIDYFYDKTVNARIHVTQLSRLFCKEFNINITLIRYICNICMLKKVNRLELGHILITVLTYLCPLCAWLIQIMIHNTIITCIKQYHVCGKEKGLEKSAIFWWSCGQLLHHSRGIMPIIKGTLYNNIVFVLL